MSHGVKRDVKRKALHCEVSCFVCVGAGKHKGEFFPVGRGRGTITVTEQCSDFAMEVKQDFDD